MSSNSMTDNPSSQGVTSAFKTIALCITSALVTILSGCSGLPTFEPGDSGPSHRVDVSHIPNAVPKVEPKSRYGNKSSYTVRGRRYHVMSDSRGYVARGVASWYGNKFHGRRTSSGERYDMYAMTAAHRSLPLPTYAQVTNLRNGRSVVVKVNDRGPFHDNRLIDLSYSAASKLGILGKGTGLVEVKAIDPRKPKRVYAQAEKQPVPRISDPFASPAPRSPGPAKARPNRPPTTKVPAKPTKSVPIKEPDLFLQIGSFGSRFNAEQLRRKVKGTVSETIRIMPTPNQQMYRVQVGPLASVEKADNLSETLGELGIRNMRIILD